MPSSRVAAAGHNAIILSNPACRVDREPMQLRFFTIPIQGGEEAAEELDRFLAAERILSVDRRFVEDGGASAWALCVSYEPADQGRPPSAWRPWRIGTIWPPLEATPRIASSWRSRIGSSSVAAATV
jgi:hypothetical protein